jgi:hypothetical protein
MIKIENNWQNNRAQAPLSLYLRGLSSGFGDVLTKMGFSPSEFRWGTAVPFGFRDLICLGYADGMKPFLTESEVEA